MSRALAACLVLLLAVAGWASAAWAGPPRPGDGPRVGFVEENDSLYFDRDKHYTQGLRLSYLSPDGATEGAWDRVFDALGAVPTVFVQDGKQDRRYALSFGQSIFTPTNLKLRELQEGDRPYAGWGYVGVSLLQETHDRALENLELQLGVVGPAALGEEVQNHWHQFVGAGLAKGWRNELHNEPAVTLSYERLWRVSVLGGDNGVDLVPQVGATVGNVFTYGQAGALLRLGKNLGVDYGPQRIRPALSGTDYFAGHRLAGKLGFYVFVGAVGRVVAHNVFLDGNLFREGPSVHKKPLVGDLQAGLSVFWGPNVRLDATVVERSEEFSGQHGPDEIGTVALTVSW